MANDLVKALEFFDRVMECSPEERIAVGSDHWIWVLKEARKAVDYIEKLEALLDIVTATAKNRKAKIKELADQVFDLESDINWRIDNEDN